MFSSFFYFKNNKKAAGAEVLKGSLLKSAIFLAALKTLN